MIKVSRHFCGTFITNSYKKPRAVSFIFQIYQFFSSNSSWNLTHRIQAWGKFCGLPRFVVQALITTDNHDMLFALRFVEKPRDQIAVLRNVFWAHRTDSAHPRLADRITMRTSAHRAALVRNIHRTIDFAYYVLAFGKRRSANRAIYERVFFRGFGRNIFFPRKECQIKKRDYDNTKPHSGKNIFHGFYYMPLRAICLVLNCNSV